MTAVRTAGGLLLGRDQDGVRLHLGIPYAAPPVGPRRFRLPEPVNPWSGTKEAFTSGPAAPQLVPRGLPAPPRTSEDCLYLDVYAPADATGAPVLVWLHGGAFRFGWAGDYDGSHLARRHGVVVVTVGYRLGLLGFAALDHLDPTFRGSANAGVADQVAALGWVQENIAAFGGDPGNVTLVGQSAGGESAAALLAAPAASGLFHRAIIQSATIDLPPLDGHQRGLVDRAVQALDGSTRDIEALVAADVEDLLAAQAAAVDRHLPTFDLRAAETVDLFPCIDAEVVTTTPIAAAAAPGAVPLLLGCTRHEGMILDGALPARDPTDDETADALRAVGLEPGPAIDAYRAVIDAATNRDVLVGALGDRLVRNGMLRLAEAASADAYLYLFTWESDLLGRPAAFHAVDLPFLWDADKRGRWLRYLGSRPRPERLAEAIHEAWTTFARDGTPTSDGVTWRTYDTGHRSTFELGDHIGVVADPDRATRELWGRNPATEEHR